MVMSKAKPESTPPAARRVLVVDDGAGTGPELAAALQRLGCEVTVAPSESAAAEALARLMAGAAGSNDGATQDLAVVVARKGNKPAVVSLTAHAFPAPDALVAALSGARTAQDKDVPGGVLKALDISARYAQLRGLWAAAQSAMHESESLLRSILDNATAVIYAKDRDGCYVFINKKFESIFGITNEAIKGKVDRHIFPADVADVFRKNDLNVIYTGQPIEIEETVPQPDGLHHYISIKFPMLDSEGAIRGVCGISTDISDHKRSEAQLRQAQRMEAVGHLTGGVAHDFNNLHTIILGNLELAEEKLEKGTTPHNHVRRALDAARRASTLTERLLAYSRKQVLQPQSTDVNGLVIRTAALLESSLGEEIQVRTVLAGDARPAVVDPSRLEDAIFTLAANARDAMPKGGIITIETRNVYLDEFDAIRAEVATGHYVMISISDNGVGMTPEVRSRAFEPFFTTKEVGKGVGLGLSMVQGFVLQSGGRVIIESEPGKGARVRVLLPQATSDGPREAETVLRPQMERLVGNETILVVADDPDLRRTAVAGLEEFGYNVLQAVDGVTALAVTAAAPMIDLLVTEVALPGTMNGRELAAVIRQRRPGAKVLYLTGCGRDELPAEELADGSGRHIDVPFRRIELESCVRDVLDSVPCILESRPRRN